MPGWLAALVSSLIIGLGFYGIALFLGVDYGEIKTRAWDPAISQKYQEPPTGGAGPKKFTGRLDGSP